MTHEELIKRLTWLANAKQGQDMPEWLDGGINNWGPPISEVARDALNTIEALKDVGR